MTRIAALERLADADARLRRDVDRYLSLDPRREAASGLSEIAEAVLRVDEEPALCLDFAQALETIALGQLQHFPENIFWDFDFVAADMLASARRHEGGAAEYLQSYAETTVGLQALFGCNSLIRFRYVHDFTYGLDWSRWVTSDPEHNAKVGPFDLAFLRRLRKRGAEIKVLVERDTPDYPRLAAGDWRNPFRFSRQPEHEDMLHRDLAARGGLPVECWRKDAVPDWRRRCTALRLERAEALGIPGDYL